MRVTGVTANLPVADIEAARGFYTFFVRDPDGNVINVVSHRAE